MTDAQRLEKLLRSELFLKRTTAGYTPSGPNWKVAMPLLWEVRMSLRGKPDGYALAEAHGLLKLTEQGYNPRAPRWKEAMRLIDQVEASLSAPKVPALGPVTGGGKSILLESPTHNTDGLGYTGSQYPAFDYGWAAGVSCLAVERLVVTSQSSAAGGDAFFARGMSGLEYWYGHLVRAPATGTWFDKGQLVARIAAIPGTDHGHLGINAKPLIGRDLKWGRNGNGPDYTYGSPTIGAQLLAALEV